MRHIYSNNSSAKLILIQHICMDVITGHLDIKSIHFVFKPTSPMSCVMKCIQRGDIQKNGQKMCAICLAFGRIVSCFVTSQKIEKVFLQRALFQGQRRFDSGTNPKASRIYCPSLAYYVKRGSAFHPNQTIIISGLIPQLKHAIIFAKTKFISSFSLFA